MTKKVELKNGAEGHNLTTEEARRGGVASGKARRRRKTFRELVKTFGELDMKNEAVRKKMEAFGIDPEDFNNDMATVVSLYQKALKGDVGAFATIRDTAGERPIIKQETTVVTPKPLVDLTDMFDKKKDKK